jgi:hypothetical protein
MRDAAFAFTINSLMQLNPGAHFAGTLYLAVVNYARSAVFAERAQERPATLSATLNSLGIMCIRVFAHNFCSALNTLWNNKEQSHGVGDSSNLG